MHGAGKCPSNQKKTRLDRLAAKLLSIDVEYTSFDRLKKPAAATSSNNNTNLIAKLPQMYQLPTEICLIDSNKNVLLHTYCNPVVDDASEDSSSPSSTSLSPYSHYKGGRHPSRWSQAPSLATIRSQLSTFIQGAPLVGHNLKKDLKALGLHHPDKLCYDTMHYFKYRTLKRLAAELLGREIQGGDNGVHDPLEDATAVMDIYLQYVHYNKENMGYEDLVEVYLSEIGGGGEGDRREEEWE